MSFIDLHNRIHREAIQQEFPPSSRVLMYTLLGEFNSARWIDSLVFSVRDLSTLTGLPTTSVQRAKHFLASRQLIKCEPFKNKTRFSLGDELLTILKIGNGTVVEQSWNSSGTVAEQ